MEEKKKYGHIIKKTCFYFLKLILTIMGIAALFLVPMIIYKIIGYSLEPAKIEK